MGSHQNLAHQAEAEPSPFRWNKGLTRYPTPGNGLQMASSCISDKPWSH